MRVTFFYITVSLWFKNMSKRLQKKFPMLDNQQFIPALVYKVSTLTINVSEHNLWTRYYHINSSDH